MGQLRLITDRKPIEAVLADPNTSAEIKAKLKLALDVKKFMNENLNLVTHKNYSSFVQLKQDYVTYVISAADPWKLETLEWSYPLFGKMPYRGFYNEEDALLENKKIQADGYDTYLRGVSAYSSLGWLNDPILSSMLRYETHDFVDTLIHETVHLNVYIKNNADFNERLAVFLGQKGAELYFLNREGSQSGHLDRLKLESEDLKLFSVFITEEIKNSEVWFNEKLAKINDMHIRKELKKNHFSELKKRFTVNIKPKLKSNRFLGFEKIELNNARLLIYKTYMQDLSDFQKLWNQFPSFSEFLKQIKNLEKSKDPNSDLKKLIL